MRQTLKRIDDFALIGDCETAALVHRSGSIEWLCWPDFSSPACLAALLGTEENGAWEISASDPAARSRRRYRPDTLILETSIETPSGAAAITDFMPIRNGSSNVVRIVEGLSGVIELRSALRLRFDYGRLRPVLRETEDGFEALAGRHGARLVSDVPMRRGGDDRFEAILTVSHGERLAFVMTHYPAFDSPPPRIDPFAALAHTERYWRDWCSRCAYDGPWRDAVMRSLITMKALIYRPSGAIAAAPTSSLAEEAGGAGAWDYRFCWLRDATFTLLALLHAGYVDEAVAWRNWLLLAIAGDATNVQPVYGLDGETRLPEWEAPWLEGFNGAKPVRFGNKAARQRQFDVFGEIADALHQSREHGLGSDAAVWDLQMRLAERLEQVWREPGNGIWESRADLRHYTLSRAMIWLAFDRTIEAAEKRGGVGQLDRWREIRAAVHAEVCRRGFRPSLGSFVRDFETDTLDASLLLLPQIGFLPADDPRIRGTVEAIGRQLSRQGFIYRARREDFGQADSSFLACCFWYADALLLLGRRDEAEQMFEKLMSIRNDVGLLSEEYDPDARRLMGNFPQALSHLALVNTALNLWTADGPAHRRRSKGARS